MLLFVTSALLAAASVQAPDRTAFWGTIIASVFTGLGGLLNLYLSWKTKQVQHREIVPKVEELRKTVGPKMDEHNNVSRDLVNVLERLAPKDQK